MIKSAPPNRKRSMNLIFTAGGKCFFQVGDHNSKAEALYKRKILNPKYFAISNDPVQSDKIPAIKNTNDNKIEIR